MRSGYWRKSMTDVSVVVTSYNHSPYIAQCLLSIAQQTTQRKVEIIWCDDASTDDTIALGELALRNSPYQVKRLHYLNNRKSRKVPTLLDKIELCQGRYIFWAEGDDFWLDVQKIDLQIDALEAHQGVNICFTPAHVFTDSSLQPKSILAGHCPVSKIFSLDDVINGDGGFMPTISLCFKREVFEKAPNWLFEYLPVGDYPMQVVASSPRGALFLPHITCGYRENVLNSWTKTIYENPIRRLTFELEFLQLLLIMVKEFPERKPAFERIFRNHFNSLNRISTEQSNSTALQKAAIFYADLKHS
jgi:glycosyltransferase involved in cell wall biosynthesis